MKRAISLLLTIVMVIGMLPMPATAQTQEAEAESAVETALLQDVAAGEEDVLPSEQDSAPVGIAQTDSEASDETAIAEEIAVVEAEVENSIAVDIHSSGDVVASGTCGENLTWTLDAHGVLTISGEGEMADYSESSTPWQDYREQILEVIFRDHIASVSARAFDACTGLSKVTFHADAPTFGADCFCGVSAAVYYPAENTTWEKSVQQNYGGELEWIAADCDMLVNIEESNEDISVKHGDISVVEMNAEDSSLLNTSDKQEPLTTTKLDSQVAYEYFQTQALLSNSPAMVSNLTVSNYAPYATIEYDYSESVECGTIRYISQITSSSYFNWNYWPKSSFGSYSSPGSECGTACISMAHSYIGINYTPIDILGTDGKTKFDKCAESTYTSYSTSNLSTAVNKYISGEGKYSPVVIHLNYGATIEANDRGHYIMIIGKVSDNVYQIADPASNSLTNYTINGTSITYCGVANTINQVHQWYNPNVSLNSCTVTFNANGGTCSETKRTIDRGKTVGTLPTPSRDGFTFLGWYTSASGGTNVTASTVFTSSTTIYAHWEYNEAVDMGLDFYAFIRHSASGHGLSNVSRNVELAPYGETGSLWRFVENTSDGTYTIISMADGEALDIADNLTANGTNIQTHPINGTYAQKWYIVWKERGYSLIAANSFKALDIYDSRTEIGTNAILYESHGQAAQLFEFDMVYFPVVTPSDSSIELVLGETDSQTIYLTVSNTGEFHKDYWLRVSGGASVAEFELGSPTGDVYPLKINALKPGTTSCYVDLLQADTNSLYDECEIDITVKSSSAWEDNCEHSYTYAVDIQPTLESTGLLNGTCSKCGYMIYVFKNYKNKK